ncbi:MAG: T9SS type A sorting domain-containing protein [Bacteroidota bacterium]
MKRKFTFFSMAFVIAFSLLSVNKIQAQNEVYWREGFESGTITGVGSPTAITPIYAVGGLSGQWFLSGTYRTTGTACPAPAAPGHIRWRNISGVTDSGFLVTPTVDYGIQEFHMLRTRAGRYFSIYSRDDTSAQATSGWTLRAYLVSTTTTCVDTTIMINSPTARRLKIVGRFGTDSDVDSMWLTSVNAIVPIKFNGINAAQTNGMVKVSWNIATEINSLRYDIERSLDGRHFTVLGNVNATNAGSYSFIDNSPSVGDNFYRIKGIDKDGSVTMSSIVRINSNRKSPELTVLPNPIVSGKLNVQLNNFEKGAYTLTLFSNAGQKMFSAAVNNETGSFTQTLQLPSSVQPGVYKMVLVNGSNKVSKTVVVQ